MNKGEGEEESKFRQSLVDMLLGEGIIRNGNHKFEFELFDMYQQVCRRGGFQAVTNKGQWKEVNDSMGLDEEPKVLKKFYMKFIHKYEQKNYFGLGQPEDFPTLIQGVPRKIIKTENKDYKPKLESFSDLKEEISKALEEEEEQTNAFYLKKTKLNTSKAEMKRIVIGLQSFAQKKDLLYSLNMLILYSVNAHFPFLFENNEKIFSSLSNFSHMIYPPKNQEEKEYLRTVTLIFRNMTMNPINLKFMLGTPIFQLFVGIFNSGFDSECSKNIVDVMTGLVKVGWDCHQILKDIDNALLEEKFEDVEGSVELMRGLIDERDQNLAPAVMQNPKAFIRALIQSKISIEVKEQILQIISFVTDISTQTREELLRNQTMLQIIVGILQHMRKHEKLAQFAALTLNNMSSSVTSKSHLKRYESELMTVGFTDDSLAGIIANVLFQINHN